MPKADRSPRHGAACDRVPAEPVVACELRPFAHPVSDALVLAAVERAERHHPTRTGAGVLLGEVFAHMGFVYNGAATRQLRPRLDALLADGALEHAHRQGIKLWALTSTGRRRLAQLRRRDGPVQLPESPQHRLWRHTRERAGARIGEYRSELQALVDEAGVLLASGTKARSDRWLCLANRMQCAAMRLGAAVYCLSEWAEPDDARADVDSYDDPGDAKLDAEKRARLRYLRTGRRHMLRGEIGI